MIQLRVTSDRAQTVVGLGVFAEGEERLMSLEDLESWVRTTGLIPDPENFPEGLEVELVVVDDEKSSEEEATKVGEGA